MSVHHHHPVVAVSTDSIRLRLATIEVGRPDRFVDALACDPRIKLLYQQKAGVWEGWTAGQHTYMVERGLRDYPVAASWELSAPDTAEITRRELGIGIALHDIAKNLDEDYHSHPLDLRLLALPSEVGSDIHEKKHFQHTRTNLVIDYIAPSLPLNLKQLETIKTLIDGGDVLGHFFRFSVQSARPPVYRGEEQRADIQERFANVATMTDLSDQFKNKSIDMDQYRKVIGEWQKAITEFLEPQQVLESYADEAASWIKQAASRLNLAPNLLWKYLINYFQLDVMAYTADSGGDKPALDHLFKINPEVYCFDQNLYIFSKEKDRFIFNDTQERLLALIEQRL